MKYADERVLWGLYSLLEEETDDSVISSTVVAINKLLHWGTRRGESFASQDSSIKSPISLLSDDLLMRVFDHLKGIQYIYLFISISISISIYYISIYLSNLFSI